MQNHLDDILFIAGAALITFGVGMIYIPAGVISAGVFCLIGSVIYSGYMLANTRPTAAEKSEKRA